VQSYLALDATEQFFGHIGKGAVLIDKAGVAAMGWDGYAIEDGCRRWGFAKAPVGVPGIGENGCLFVGGAAQLDNVLAIL